MTDLEPCPGCGALFPHSDRATHPYIGASPGCWEMFTALGAGCEPDAGLIAASRVAFTPTGVPASPRESANGATLRPLLTDAYAVQHPGDDSPQAIQSVAVHLLTLHGVLHGGQPIERALWIRRRPLRERGLFHRLHAPPSEEMFTLRHLRPGGGVDTPVSIDVYVTAVYERWAAVNAAEVTEWYARYVVAD